MGTDHLNDHFNDHFEDTSSCLDDIQPTTCFSYQHDHIFASLGCLAELELDYRLPTQRPVDESGLEYLDYQLQR